MYRWLPLYALSHVRCFTSVPLKALITYPQSRYKLPRTSTELLAQFHWRPTISTTRATNQGLSRWITKKSVSMLYVYFFTRLRYTRRFNRRIMGVTYMGKKWKGDGCGTFHGTIPALIWRNTKKELTEQRSTSGTQQQPRNMLPLYQPARKW